MPCKEYAPECKLPLARQYGRGSELTTHCCRLPLQPASSSPLVATIAVDTDAEFYALFTDAQAAANYVALMVACGCLSAHGRRLAKAASWRVMQAGCALLLLTPAGAWRCLLIWCSLVGFVAQPGLCSAQAACNI